MPKTTRITLLSNLRDLNDNPSWEEFLNLYLPVITSTIRRFQVNSAEVEDIQQEVLLQMSKTIQGYEKDPNKGCFRSYLRQVTANKVKDHWRKKKFNLASIENPGLIPEVQHQSEIWTEERHRRFLIEALKQVRTTSKKLTWDCFQEHVLLKKKAESVASDLGVSVNAIYVNSSRILARVREVALNLKREHCGEGSQLP